MRWAMLCVPCVLVLAACDRGTPPPTGGAAPAKPAAVATQPATQPAAWNERVAEALRKSRPRLQQRAEEDLARLEKRLAQLRQSAANAVESARPELERRVNEVAAQTAAARERLAKLKEASDEAWKALHEAFNESIAELRTAVQAAEASTRPAQPGPATQPPE